MPFPLRALQTLSILAWCCACASDACAAEQHVRIGVLASNDANACYDQWEALASYLAERVPGRRFTIEPASFDSLISRARKGDFDLVLTVSSLAIPLMDRNGAVPLVSVVRQSPLGEESSAGLRCGSVVFWRADNDSLRIGDLRTRQVAAVSPETMGGWLTVYAEARRAGIWSDIPENVVFVGSHDHVVRSVRDGKYDIGICRTGTLERMAGRGMIRLTDFHVAEDFLPHEERSDGDTPRPSRILRSTPSYPSWPMLAMPSLDRETARAVTIALLQMPRDCQLARDARIIGWMPPEDYAPVRRVLAETTPTPLMKMTVADALAMHHRQLSLIASVLAVMLGLGCVSVMMIRRRLQSRLRKLQRLWDHADDFATERLVEKENALTSLGAKYRRIDSRMAHLQAMTDAKNERLANLSGCLSVTLEGMMDVLGRVEESSLSLQQREEVEAALRTCGAMTVVLRDLVQLSIGKSVEFLVKDGPVDVRRVGRDVLSLCHVTAEKFDVRLRLSVDETIPGSIVTDERALRQVLLNLITTAVGSARGGGVVVDLAGDLIGEDEGTLLICVRGAEVGRNLPRPESLLDERGEVDPCRANGADTIAITLAKRLAESLRGTLRAVGSSQSGFVFTIALPTKPAMSSAVDSDGNEALSAAIKNSGECDRLDPIPLPLEVLIVDDDEVAQHALGLVIESLDCNADYAIDGAEAFKKVSDGYYDLVLMDCRMPVMDGCEATRCIRQLTDERANTYIVAVTADTNTTLREEFLAAGVDEFLLKPVKPNSLHTILLERAEQTVATR